MNKKLVAVAIAGLLAAPLAQAQTANVTLYGRANMNMAFVNGGQTSAAAGNTNPTVFRVDSNSSRFGIRGTESLGGGLNAIFQIENGSINMSSTGGDLAGRDSFVGLSGSWGKFYIGHYTAPYDDITGIGANNTNNTGILSQGVLWAQGTQTDANGGFDNRLANSARYDSPTWSGFAFSGQFASAEGSPSSNSNQQSYSLKYNNGPFAAVVATQWNNNTRGLANQSLDDSAWSVAAQWQFSQFNIAAKYEWLDYDFTKTTNLKRNFWEISSTILVGANGSVYVAYGMANDGKGSAPNLARIGQVTKGNDTGASTWQVSYAHALSKRTSLFTGYAKINNDNNANYSGNFNTVRNGANPGGFTAGMWHNF